MTTAVLPYHLRQLEAYCRAHSAVTKVVFVPNKSIGHNLAVALARRAGTFVGLHFATPYDWASRQAAPALEAEGWRELTPDADAFLLEAVLEELAAEADVPAHALMPATRDVLGALRLAEVSGEQTGKVADEGLQRRLLGGVDAAYEAYLEAHRLYDPVRVFRRALERLEEAPEVAARCVYAVLDEVDLSGLEYRYVRRLASLSPAGLKRIGRNDYVLFTPRLSAARRFEDVPLVPLDGDDAEQSVGQGGRLWDEVGKGSGAGELETVEVLDAAGEVKEVLRRLQRDGVRFDEAELAFTAEDPYLTLIHALAERYHVPVTFAGGLPLTATRPGQALRMFYEWIASDLDARLLVRLFASGTVRLKDIPKPYRAATLLRKAHVGRGRARYEPALQRYASKLEDEIARLSHDGTAKERLEAELEEVRRLRTTIRRLLRLVPEGATVDIAAFVEMSVQFLTGYAVQKPDGIVRSESDRSLDERAVDSLVKRLHGIASRVPGRRPLKQLLRQFGDLLKRHRVAAATPKPGHLHVSPARIAGYTGRPHLFVVGLDQSSFPGGAAENPLLLDHQRRRLSLELPLLKERPAETNWHLMRALGMVTGRVTLLARRLDVAGEQELYPSALFLRAQKVTGAQRRPLSLLPRPDHDTDDRQVWLAHTVLDDVERGLLLCRDEDRRGQLLQRYPWLQRGRQAVQAREGRGLTPYDGILEAEDGSLALTDRLLSASRLETLLTCPYKYFLSYVVRAEPPEEVDDEEDARWLDHLSFGNVLHEIFERFIQARIADGAPVSVEAHEAELNAMLEEIVEKWREERPPVSEAAFARDVRRLRKSARIFLAAEARRQDGTRPVATEVSFGMEEDPAPPGRTEPVEIALSETVRFRLRGRIDRVDQSADGTDVIWDYKSGRASAYDPFDLVRGGKVQWALYAHALTAMTGRPVAESGYYFANDKEYGRRVWHAPADTTKMLEKLEPCFSMAASGYFPQRPSKDTCRYCDFARVCGDPKRRETELKNKLNDEDAPSSPERIVLKSWYNG